MPLPPQNPRRYSIGASEFEAESLRPGLYVTATPIGNLADVTIRALTVLAAADTILCEDTRVTAKLLQRYGIRNSMTAYHDFNGAKLRPGVIADLEAGKAIALVSDAGMPLVSDPGFKLAQAVIAKGLHLEVVPGASSTLTALALSGLPTDRFMFCGFMPEKQGERSKVLNELKAVKSTLIFFESQHRIVESLGAVAAALGERDVAVARELTKMYEEAVRGTASAVAATLAARDTIKGEITLVIGPPSGAEAIADGEIDAMLAAAAQGMAASAAASAIAKETGRSKKELYQRLLALKGDG
jgi:16S rRNA (cytidine1402-2'-O)-methyltransferase